MSWTPCCLPQVMGARPGFRSKFGTRELKKRPWKRRATIFWKLGSTCVEVEFFIRNQREYSACVEAGTIDLSPTKRCKQFQLLDTLYVQATRELEKKKDLDGTVESTDTIAKLKTKIEKSSTFESDSDFVKTLIKNCIDERVSRNEREATLEKQKIELAKLQLAQSEHFNLFFQSLERAFLTKKINDEYKSEILINLLGERAHNVLTELNDYEKLKSIVLREFQLTPRECLNSFKNAVKSSGETYIQFAARMTANFQYYCSLRKVNSFESLCDILFSNKLFETLNKETATHIGIREAEDWFRPIDLAKECDIYISSRSGSRKETPIACGYSENPFKNRPRNYKPKIRDNYPQNLERQNKNCYICGDSSHYARDCEKCFKPKESHIHNRKNANSLKVKSEKPKSDEFTQQLQYVNIFVENQPVTALIDSGCQISVLNSSLIRVNKPSEARITLSSCFNVKRMVEVSSINISLTQHSPSLSVQTAISPTLTEEFIIHPSVYTEIKKISHAKSDVLLNESESSLGAFSFLSVANVIENSSYDLSHVKNFNIRNDLSSIIKNYKPNKIKSTKLKMSIILKDDIPVCQRARRLSCSEKLQVNDQIADWLQQGIIREKCSDYCSPIVLCKKVNGAMKTSSVSSNSRSPTPSPMEGKHSQFAMLRRLFKPWTSKRKKKSDWFEQMSRTLERKISMRSTKELNSPSVTYTSSSVLETYNTAVVTNSGFPTALSSSQNQAMPVIHNVSLLNLSDVEEVTSHDGEIVLSVLPEPPISLNDIGPILYPQQFSSGLHEKKKREISTAADSVRSGWPLWNRLWSRHPIESLNEKARSLRAQAQLIQSETKTLTIERKAGERD
ncbi:phosphatase and actin regulator 2 [Trichonephila clavipes]|nr:phosphatase and actin regulator 2 [Trichonephila clavipes]